ncbi:MAG: transcription termination factor Rho [Leucobacter sp.]|nr:transcription termination factor Rho [Leucobacter sp.]
MQENSEEIVNVAAAESAAESAAETAVETAAPVRRRASRRVTAAAGETVATAVVAEGAASEPAAATPEPTAADAAPETAEPKKRVSRARKKVVPAEDEANQGEAASAAGEAASAGGGDASAEEAPAAPRRASTRRTSATSAAAKTPAPEVSEPTASEAPSVGSDEAQTEAAPKAASRRRRGTAQTAAKAAEESPAPTAEQAAGAAQDSGSAAETDAASAASAGATESGAPSAPAKRTSRSRSRKAQVEATAESATAGDSTTGATDAAADAEAESHSEKTEGAASGRGNGNSHGNGQGDSQSRSSRTRQRERKRRGGPDDEPEISDDDVLLPIAGILDVLDNYAFVRTSGYLPGTGDVYVSLGQVKKYGLRKGDSVVGVIRQPREGEGGGRQKYNAIVKVDSINSKPVEENQNRTDFADLTPIYPADRIRLEADADQLALRMVDLFAPVGKGQRGLIVGPHESGKSTALQQIARAVAVNQPDAHLMLVLVDERPEEVTALQRSINGEVIASTFDRPAEDHTTIVELAIERAKRLVELGHDVVVLIDSLTSLARAYNLAAPAAQRVAAGNLDAAAVLPVKRVLSAARNIENGGSLTVIATISAQPASRFDEALLGELEGVANMQLRMSGAAADRRVYPAVDLTASSTRNEQLLSSEAEVNVLNRVRRGLQDNGSVEALERVLQDLGRTSSNVEFLAVTQRQQA